MAAIFSDLASLEHLQRCPWPPDCGSSERPEMFGWSLCEQRVLWASVVLRKPFISICRDHLAWRSLIHRIRFQDATDRPLCSNVRCGTPKPHAIQAHSHACPPQRHARASRTKCIFILWHASIHRNKHVYVCLNSFFFFISQLHPYEKYREKSKRNTDWISKQLLDKRKKKIKTM